LPADPPPMLPAADSSALVKPGRVVLPLVYEGEIVGVLMAGREDRDWTETEHIQIQQIANTLAIACALDRRCQWLEESQKQTYLGQQEFLSTVMHQLRNPLTAIKTFAKLLTRRIRC
jgi:GAF domain-containing protein